MTWLALGFVTVVNAVAIIFSLRRTRECEERTAEIWDLCDRMEQATTDTYAAIDEINARMAAIEEARNGEVH